MVYLERVGTSCPTFELLDLLVDENLRRKLELDPAESRYVLTVYGVGYRFTDKV